MRRYAIALSALLLNPIIGFALMPRGAVAQTLAQSLSQTLTAPERTILVTGRGIESIPTTLSQVNLGVLVEADTAEAAQQQAARQSTAVVEYLRSQNVEKLATAGISLSPRYDNRGSRRVIIGYIARNTVTFRAPTETAGEIIDEAISAGATEINGVSFAADDSAIAAARTRALESATQDARAQAEAVLSALGFSSQEIVNIEIESLSAPPPNVQVRARAEAADLAASTPVIGQEQTLSAQVTLRIRY